MGIYYVRHGQTDWNLHNKMQGKTDIALNENGRQQAKITKEKLKDVPITRIYCSPLARAKETAQIINENWGLDILEEERIKERDFGVYEGQSCTSLNYCELWKISDKVPFEHAEDTKTFYKRVESFFEEIALIAQSEDILVVAHGGVSIPYHCYFHGYEYENLNEVMLANCEVSYIEGKMYDNV